jgi:RNA polymerase sigma factor (sigma-70 family)
MRPGMAGINQVEFDRIFMDWYYPVRNSVYYKSGDMQAAEDITQEAFLKVWEMREKVRAETAGSLLFKISRNLFFNHFEHSKVALKFLDGYKGAGYADAPDFELEMRDFDTRLKESLAQLDEKHRTVFLMNRIDDMTYSQIAENLGLSVKAIEKRMSIAIAFLKNKLDVRI